MNKADSFRGLAGGAYLPESTPLPDPSPAQMALLPGQSIYESLVKLGLKLESRKVPVEIIVVDSADKTPTES